MPDPTIQELFDLKGKVAFVTGGGTGLGRQATMALCEAGANAAIASRRLDVCQKTAGEISGQTGREVLALQLDVSSEEQVNEAVAAVVDRFGTIDILINNAGINRDNLIDRAETTAWREVIETNLTGAFLCSRAVSRPMIERRSGKIINIGSIYGLVGGVPSLYTDADAIWSGCSAAYAASKGGIVNLTRSMACYLAQWHINVNCICPGGMIVEPTTAVRDSDADQSFSKRYSQRCPWGRLGWEHEIKGLIAFLASAASEYVTGAIIPLDGGWTAW